MTGQPTSRCPQSGDAPQPARLVSITPELIRMANQIAANFAHHPADQAAEEIATHIKMFWTHGMRADLEAWVENGAEELHPLAVEAMRLLSAGG